MAPHETRILNEPYCIQLGTPEVWSRYEAARPLTTRKRKKMIPGGDVDEVPTRDVRLIDR